MLEEEVYGVYKKINIDLGETNGVSITIDDVDILGDGFDGGVGD